MTYDRVADRDETEAERLDRQLIELLNEVRVAVPGVQVLFAFLLTVPFTQAWDDTTDLQRDVYFATLLLTAVATAFLLAPSAVHRLLFQRGDKKFIVTLASRVTVAGLAALALAVTGAVFLVSDVIFDITAAAIAAGCILGFMVGLWYVLPLSRRFRRESELGGDGRE
jgi:hypothetical protein